jgi:two-component system LytT family response regulator
MSDVTPLRAIIVDDEPLARQILREYSASEPGLEIVAECANGFEAVKAVAEHDPDVVFLDIQMPKLDGFEVLELIDRNRAIVFATAYDEYAIRAFEVHAADYLLKPFSRERFAGAVAKAREQLAPRDAKRYDALAASASAARPLDRILVRDGAKVHVIDINAIDYVEAQDDYVAFHSGEKRVLKQQTLTELESKLDPGKFVRIHRSTILNIARLARLELYAKDSYVAILQGGKQLPVSRSGYAKLREMIG